MSRLAEKISSRLLLVLLVFVPSLLAVAVMGVRGMASASHSADVLYLDNLVTMRATEDVAQLLDTVYINAETLTATSSSAERAELTVTLIDDDIPELELALARMRDLHGDDGEEELANIDAMIADWRDFRRDWLVGRLLVSPENSTTTPASTTTMTGAANGIGTAPTAEDMRRDLDDLRNRLTQSLERERVDAGASYQQAVDTAQGATSAIIGLTGLALLLGIGAVLVLVRRVVPRALAPEEDQSEFAEIMQLAADETDAHDLLKRHIERAVSDGKAVILNRNNSANRLEAVTAVPADSPLQQGLEGAEPRSCVAVRTARAHTQDPARDRLLSCRVCGGCEGVSLCTPLMVGGEVIGSVVVNRATVTDQDEERRIRESVTQAAPVLANLRNLAVAEFRAATDSLTGLPNWRAAQDTIKRMVAQASRTLNPLAALLIDLDHFKQINDQFGHGHGDDVLAAVGSVLSANLRASDFAARQGGEEFLILLPETGVEAAVQKADAIRAALAEIFIPGVDRRITASIGVALLPDHAGDADSLQRAADRALYVAKGDGRDRTVVFDTGNEATRRSEPIRTPARRPLAPAADR